MGAWNIRPRVEEPDGPTLEDRLNAVHRERYEKATDYRRKYAAEHGEWLHPLPPRDHAEFMQRLRDWWREGAHR